MTRSITLFILIALVASLSGAIIDPAPQRGHTVGSINWTDENGRTRQLSEFAGYPTILLPIYTRCRTACLLNVDQLKKVIANSTADPRQYRVLLFSFDASDTSATLANYRAHENLPLAWSLGTASQENIDSLLESIGFVVGKAGTEFTHPNLLIFLDSKLRIAKWIYGTDYSSRDVDLGLKVAAGQSDWIGRHSEWLYALLLFGGSVCCVALFYYLAELNQLRQSSHDRDTVQPIAADL